MALMQIAEPGESIAPHQRKRVVGIDLGTSNSLVATVRSGSAEVLGSDDERLLPSVIHYLQSGQVLSGHAAIQAAEENPSETFFSIKRFMGKSFDDLSDANGFKHYKTKADEQSVAFETVQGDKSAVEISAEILKVLKQRAEKALDGELDGCVITVPAYFDEAQRQATLMAAKLAGLKVYRLLNEPTAAAVAYGLDQGQETSCYAIYDLGGGTFDVSILRLSKGVYQVLATGGDSALGGDDFDQCIAGWIAKNCSVQLTDLSAVAYRAMLNMAKQAKQHLSTQEEVLLDISTLPELTTLVLQLLLSRAKFESLIDDLLKQTLKITRRALKDANVSVEEIDDIILVGGSTRVPEVRSRLQTFFGKQSRCSIDPDEVVAMGAAKQAEILSGNKSDGNLLLDVTPLSLGIETMGGLVEKVIERNTSIPISRAQEFTTFRDGQTAMSFHVVQGEREKIEDCRSLARFELRNISPMVAGAARIKVMFAIDADGLLKVAAVEESSGQEASVVVKPSFGLSPEKIAGMLKDSYQHASEDMRLRALKEGQVEAERMIVALSAALNKDGARYLSNEALQKLHNAIDALSAAIKQDDTDTLREKIRHLNKMSEHFAGLRMDDLVLKSLGGKHIDQLDIASNPVRAD